MPVLVARFLFDVFSGCSTCELIVCCKYNIHSHTHTWDCARVCKQTNKQVKIFLVRSNQVKQRKESMGNEYIYNYCIYTHKHMHMYKFYTRFTYIHMYIQFPLCLHTHTASARTRTRTHSSFKLRMSKMKVELEGGC